MAMTAERALARLGRMVASEVAPVLDLSALAELLKMSQVADSAGIAPTDASWTPTYDLNRGAAEGWRWKAAAVAARFDFEADGGSFKRDQVLQHCLQMAGRYAARIIGSMVMPGGTSQSSLSAEEDDLDLEWYESDLYAAGTAP